VHAFQAIDARFRDLDFVESRQTVIDGAEADTNATADALLVADFNHVPSAPRSERRSLRRQRTGRPLLGAGRVEGPPDCE